MKTRRQRLNTPPGNKTRKTTDARTYNRNQKQKNKTKEKKIMKTRTAKQQAIQDLKNILEAKEAELRGPKFQELRIDQLNRIADDIKNGIGVSFKEFNRMEGNFGQVERLNNEGLTYIFTRSTDGRRMTVYKFHDNDKIARVYTSEDILKIEI
jgi:hypothetical protein